MMRELLLLVALLVALSSQQGIITRTPTTLTVIEGQAAPTYTLALGAGSPPPTSAVTVTLTQAPTGSLILSSASVILNAGTTSATITVTAVNDAAVQAQQSITISHTASSADAVYNGISIGSVTVTKRDNDAFTAISSSTSVDEGGNTFTITVTLSQATTANSATVTPAFPPGSWTSTPASAVFPASSPVSTAVVLTIKKGFDGAAGGARNIGFTVTSMDTLFSNQFILPLTVTVNASPFQLVASPTDTSVVAGMTAYFNVQVTGSMFTISWENENAFAMPISKRQTLAWTVIPAATTPTLTVTTTVASQTGVQYRATITATGGSTSRITTTPATLTITSSAAVAPAVMSGASGAGSSSSGAFGASGAAAFGDPHLIGWNGATFDFDGQNGRVYNLFSDAGVSINMRLGKLRASTRDFLPGVYMTEIGMQFDESRIHIAAGGPVSQDMGSVVVDGHVLDLAHAYAQPLNISRHLFNGACSFEYSSPMQQATAWGIADEYERVTGAVVVRLGDSYTFTVLMLQRVGFYLLPRRTLAVIGNLDKNSLKSLPHGLLGQTARPEQDSDESSRRRALSPAARAFKIEGSESDYEIQSEQIFGNDFAFSRFAKR